MFFKGLDKYILYLLAIGLIYRIVFFFFFYTHITIFPDSAGYIELSEYLSSFEIEGYSGKRSPGYPFLITLAFGNLYVLLFYQFLIGTLTTVLWYKTLKNLEFSRKASFLISLFLMSFLHVLFYETAVLTEALTLFIISAIVFLITIGYFNRNDLNREIIMGLLLGFLVLVKPFFVYVPFLIYGVHLLNNFNVRGIVHKKILIFILPLFAYFGWSYINKLNTGHFISTTFLGLNMAQNCVYFAEKGPEEYKWIIEPYVEYRNKSIEEGKGVAMSIWYAYNSGAFDKYEMKFADFSGELGTYAKQTISANPVDYLKQVVFRSWVDFWKTTIYWNNDQFNFEKANTYFNYAWYFQGKLLFLLKMLFVLMAPIILFKRLRRRKWDMTAFFTLFVLVPSILQALVTYGTNNRFSFPFEFLMIMVLFLFNRENVQILNKTKKPLISLS